MLCYGPTAKPFWPQRVGSVNRVRAHCAIGCVRQMLAEGGAKLKLEVSTARLGFEQFLFLCWLWWRCYAACRTLSEAAQAIAKGRSHLDDPIVQPRVFSRL